MAVFERLAVRDNIKRFHPGSAASMMSQTERLNRWEETMAQIVDAPSARMTNEGIAFVAASIVIGMVAGADAYAIGVGIALLILTGAMYFIR